MKGDGRLQFDSESGEKGLEHNGVIKLSLGQAKQQAYAPGIPNLQCITELKRVQFIVIDFTLTMGLCTLPETTRVID